jgi:protein TonB
MTGAVLLYQGRHWLAVVPAALLLATLMLLSMRTLIEAHVRDEPPMSVALLDALPHAALTEPPPALARTPLAARLAERVAPTEPRPAKTFLPTEPPESAALVVPPPEPPEAINRQPANLPQPTAADLPAAQMTERPASEAQYLAALRGYLESVKRYPASREARLQRPTGTVRVWLELNRDGSLRESGIEKSSNAMVLDSAALTTVRQGHFPAFPADAFAGKAGNRFTVSLEYRLDGAG